MYLNEIKIIGFVGQDAELKSPQNSKELVRFDVATKESAMAKIPSRCQSPRSMPVKSAGSIRGPQKMARRPSRTQQRSFERRALNPPLFFQR